MIVVIGLMIVSFRLNISLGMWRARTKKFSLCWFISIHIAMPLIYMLRISEGLNAWSIPFFVASAVFGQLVGGRLWLSKKVYIQNQYF